MAFTVSQKGSRSDIVFSKRAAHSGPNGTSVAGVAGYRVWSLCSRILACGRLGSILGTMQLEIPCLTCKVGKDGRHFASCNQTTPPPDDVGTIGA